MGTRNIIKPSGPTELGFYRRSPLSAYIRRFFSFLRCTACGHSQMIIFNVIIIFLSHYSFFIILLLSLSRRSVQLPFPITLPILSPSNPSKYSSVIFPHLTFTPPYHSLTQLLPLFLSSSPALSFLFSHLRRHFANPNKPIAIQFPVSSPFRRSSFKPLGHNTGAWFHC